MENGEKKDYEVSSDPPYYAHEGETLDMRGRHGRASVVKNEAAELYGDIHTAEGQSSSQPNTKNVVAKTSKSMATSHAGSNLATSSSLPLEELSELVCFSESAAHSLPLALSPFCSATPSRE